MTQTRWAVDGPDEADIELGGRKFSANDEGAPMMCNLVCSSMGRHVHIEYCRAGGDARCEGAELQHINARMIPNPDRPKDAITHNLYWRRMGTLSAPILFPFLKTPYVISRLQRSRALLSYVTRTLRPDFRPLHP
jgi:hypothetical protein